MRARVERGCQCQLVRRGDLRCRRRVTRRCTRKFFLAFRHSWKQYVCHSYHPTFILVCLPFLLQKQTTKRYYNGGSEDRNRSETGTSILTRSQFFVRLSARQRRRAATFHRSSKQVLFFLVIPLKYRKSSASIGDDPHSAYDRSNVRSRITRNFISSLFVISVLYIGTLLSIKNVTCGAGQREYMREYSKTHRIPAR